MDSLTLPWRTAGRRCALLIPRCFQRLVSWDGWLTWGAAKGKPRRDDALPAWRRSPPALAALLLHHAGQGLPGLQSDCGASFYDFIGAGED